MKKFSCVLVLMLSFGLFGSAVADINNGLVAHYKFNGNASDSSGNGNHGTEYGGLNYATGKIGQAASFDGVDDYIQIEDSSSLEFTDTLSVSLWVKINGNTNTGQRMVTKMSIGTQNIDPINNEFHLSYDSSSIA